MPYVLLLLILFIYVNLDCVVCVSILWQCCLVCSHVNKAI